MDLHSGRRDLTTPSLMFMRMLQGTFLFNGKPPEMPLIFVGESPQYTTPNSAQGRVGARRDQVISHDGLE